MLFVSVTCMQQEPEKVGGWLYSVNNIFIRTPLVRITGSLKLQPLFIANICPETNIRCNAYGKSDTYWI